MKTEQELLQATKSCSRPLVLGGLVKGTRRYPWLLDGTTFVHKITMDKRMCQLVDDLILVHSLEEVGGMERIIPVRITLKAEPQTAAYVYAVNGIVRGFFLTTVPFGQKLTTVVIAWVPPKFRRQGVSTLFLSWMRFIHHDFEVDYNSEAMVAVMNKTGYWPAINQ